MKTGKHQTVHVRTGRGAEGKTFINMGLGIDAGIAFFKTKWGAKAFLKYFNCSQSSPSGASWNEAFDQFARL